MSRDRFLWASRDESGAVAIVVAITLTVLLMMAALVIDLAGLRADRVHSKSIADQAAAAAAVDYRPRVAGSIREACLEAVAFASANVDATAQAVPSQSCEDLFAEDLICTTGTDPQTAAYDLGGRRLFVTIPVAAGDDLMQVAPDYPAFPQFDGRPCDRIGVRIERDRSYLFARVAGFDGGSTSIGSVARASAPGELGEFASLIVLRRNGCETVSATGQGDIYVSGLPVAPDDYIPGIITVDTVPGGGSCNNQQDGEVIFVNPSNAGVRIAAEDHLYSYGLRQGADPADVYRTDFVPSRISPEPEPGKQITRSPVDYLVNCLASYSTAEADRWSPNHPDSIGEIDGCDVDDDDAGESYVQPLHAALQPLGSPGNNPGNAAAMDALDEGWAVFPDDFPGQSCNSATGTYGPGLDGDKDHVYINCGTSGSTTFTPSDMEFVDVDTIVSRNEMSMTNGDRLVINSSTGNGTVLYFQDGGISRNGGIFDIVKTFVYLENGPIDMGGSDALTWRAPFEGNTSCVTAVSDFGVGASDIPAAGCFAPLALWSNVKTTLSPPIQNVNRMTGGSAMDLGGSFFTPNSRFELAGGSAYTLADAQFFAAELANTGQGALTMTPNPETNIEIPLVAGGLIR